MLFVEHGIKRFDDRDKKKTLAHTHTNTAFKLYKIFTDLKPK
jgi:hypothetical protein